MRTAGPRSRSATWPRPTTSTTGVHRRDVVELTLKVVDELGLTARERRDAEFAALLHDVGKVRVPNSIINKPGPLT